MNLLAAEAFVTVVELGTIQAAADRLGVSAATVSRRVSALEDELGVRLVERTTRSLRVTAPGRVLFDRCTLALRALSDAAQLVTASDERVAGTVRISAAPNLGPLLVDALAHVQQAHPQVQVVLIETERYQHPHGDDVDLFVRVGPVSDERMVARLLGRYPHVLVASAAYVARAGAPTHPDELAAHPLLAFGARPLPGPVELVSAAGDTARVDLQPTLLCNSYATITDAARRGLGIAEVPAILCEPGMVRILPDWTLGEVPLHLLYAADRLLPSAVRAVIDGILATVPGRILELGG
jgi:DNA-binding transcriptional LysR family regulator